MIQFFKLLSRIVRGRFSLGQTLQVIALGQKHTSPVVEGGRGRCQSGRRSSLQGEPRNKTLAPALPDVPSGTQAPPPQFNCRTRHRRRQQRLNPLGSTPPSSSIPLAQSPKHLILVRHPARAFSALLHLHSPPPIPHPPNLERSHRYIL